MSLKKLSFQKPSLTIEEQVALLSSRGCLIQDQAAAVHSLTFISYYRFCGYGIEFEGAPLNGEKKYLPGTTFEQILDCYVFDRKLRLLIIDAIERIEVAIRTTITNAMSLKYGSHWYMRKELFLKNFNHEDLIKTIKKETAHGATAGSKNHAKRERFLHHYFEKYAEPELPPIWMVAEVLSLGTWSIIFSKLKFREDQKAISQYFDLPYSIMESWLHMLTYLRNLCAHHTKLWSRSFTLKPQIAKKYENQLSNNSSVYAQLVILKIFLNIISPGTNWGERLTALLKEHPEIDLSRMGFPLDWACDPLWFKVD